MEGLLSGNLLSKASIFGAGGGSTIKSIQRGMVVLGNNTSATATISSVKLSNSIIQLHIGGYYNSSEGYQYTSETLALGKFLDDATIEISRMSGSSTTAIQVYWTVIEFNNVKSIQKGDYTGCTSAGSTTISQIDLNNSFLIYSSKAADGNYRPLAFLYSDTEIRFAIRTNGNGVIHWTVIEFYK